MATKEITKNKLSDEELMVLYQAGDYKSFELLFERHNKKIYGFLLRKTFSTQTAADLVQDVFLKIHKSKHLYKADYRLLPWLFTITNSVFLDHTRLKRKMRFESPSEFSEGFSQLHDDKNSLNIGSLIDALPESNKVAIQLRYYDDKSFDEIANILGTSSVNVRKIVSRGLKRLKNFLKDG